MFKIREEQIKVFEATQARRFEDRVIRFLQDEFADAAESSPEELRPQVASQIAKATSYGLKSEQEAVTYVVTAWLLGSDFDEKYQEAREVLADAESPPEVKAEWLAEWGPAKAQEIVEEGALEV